jgi:hypothetical protein
MSRSILSVSLRVISLAALAALGVACQSTAPAQLSDEKPNAAEGAVPPGAAPQAAAPPAAPAGKPFGAAITETTPTALSSVLADPKAYSGKTVLVDGDVRSACSRKGCWMEIATSLDKAAPGCRVTFKDYGFFVPTDSQGSKARVQGLVQVTNVPKERVDHLEGEGASFPNKNPDGTATEVRLVATGVELRRG